MTSGVPGVAGAALAALASGALAAALRLAVMVAHRPSGLRGERRAAALAGSPLFAVAEPWIAATAVLVGPAVPPPLRRRAGTALERAGHWLGLTPDELVAVTVLAALGAAALASVLARWAGEGPARAASGGLAAGAAGVRARLAAAERARVREAERALPAAIDLLALCTGAGQDFPGAIRQYVGSGAARSLLQAELGVVLCELRLGQTRRSALARLARRLPADSIRAFVAAVDQADEKGNALGPVLRVQSAALRARRTTLAEESAAQAGVLMVFPLLLLLGCVLLLLLGPFVLSGGFG